MLVGLPACLLREEGAEDAIFMGRRSGGVAQNDAGRALLDPR